MPEHKTRRPQLEKSMACPGPYDGFWTFPRSKTGYSGVCTYVDSRYCVPLKAEEGITGLLLDDNASTMRPPWTAEERIGSYPDVDAIQWMEDYGSTPFDLKRLDTEGRAVVCDFGSVLLAAQSSNIEEPDCSSCSTSTVRTKRTRHADHTR
jgi:AP endonuclease-2